MDQTSAIDALAALAHPTRIAAFRLLVREGPDGLPALEIGRRLGVIPSTLSGHLATLRRAGIMTATRQAKEIRYAADLKAINGLVGFLLADCCGGRIGNCSEILSLLNAGVPEKG